jgi:ribosomal protein S6E (S10)
LSALGVVTPGAGVAKPGARRPRAERGNLKAPEVTQLNYRLTTKLHKAKVCDDPKAPGAMRRKRVGNGSNIEKSHRVLVALGLAVCPLGDY